MKNSNYKNFTMGDPFSDYDRALRYLRTKDQWIIWEDDPDFFAAPIDNRENISLLSSSRAILRKIPRK